MIQGDRRVRIAALADRALEGLEKWLDRYETEAARFDLGDGDRAAKPPDVATVRELVNILGACTRLLDVDQALRGDQPPLSSLEDDLAALDKALGEVRYPEMPE